MKNDIIVKQSSKDQSDKAETPSMSEPYKTAQDTVGTPVNATDNSQVSSLDSNTSDSQLTEQTSEVNQAVVLAQDSSGESQVRPQESDQVGSATTEADTLQQASKPQIKKPHNSSAIAIIVAIIIFLFLSCLAVYIQLGR